MKIFLKKFLRYYLKFITKIVLWLHQPTIIAIAGSINKTFVKDEVTAVLIKRGLDARSNPKSFNTEIGLPLAILALNSGYNSYRQWLPIIKAALVRIWQPHFPKYLILELGTSDPGDMQYLLTIIKPTIVIITDITQRYLESFSDMDELVDEYKQLAINIPASGLLILNNDNPRIRGLAELNNVPKITFGFKENSDYLIHDLIKTVNGQDLKITHQNLTTRHQIKLYGTHHAYAYAIGAIINNYEPLYRK